METELSERSWMSHSNGIHLQETKDYNDEIIIVIYQPGYSNEPDFWMHLYSDNMVGEWKADLTGS